MPLPGVSRENASLKLRVHFDSMWMERFNRPKRACVPLTVAHIRFTLRLEVKIFTGPFGMWRIRSVRVKNHWNPSGHLTCPGKFRPKKFGEHTKKSKKP